MIFFPALICHRHADAGAGRQLSEPPHHHGGAVRTRRQQLTERAPAPGEHLGCRGGAGERVAEQHEERGTSGYGDVTQVKTAEEDLMFSLPKELRRDLTGATDARALGGRNRN